MKILKAAGYISLILIISTVPARAQTVWDGGGADDDWFTALNWDNDTVPNGIPTDVIIGAPSPVNVDGNVNINSLMIMEDGVLQLSSFNNEIFFGGSSTAPLVNLGSITIEGLSLIHI